MVQSHSNFKLSLKKTRTTTSCIITDILITLLIPLENRKDDKSYIWSSSISFVYNPWLYFFMTLNLHYIKMRNIMSKFIYFEITRVFYAQHTSLVALNFAKLEPLYDTQTFQVLALLL